MLFSRGDTALPKELSVHEIAPKSALFVRPGANAAQIRSAFTKLEISNSIRNEK